MLCRLQYPTLFLIMLVWSGTCLQYCLAWMRDDFEVDWALQPIPDRFQNQNCYPCFFALGGVLTIDLDLQSHPYSVQLDITSCSVLDDTLRSISDWLRVDGLLVRPVSTMISLFESVLEADSYYSDSWSTFLLSCAYFLERSPGQNVFHRWLVVAANVEDGWLGCLR